MYKMKPTQAKDRFNIGANVRHLIKTVFILIVKNNAKAVLRKIVPLSVRKGHMVLEKAVILTLIKIMEPRCKKKMKSL